MSARAWAQLLPAWLLPSWLAIALPKCPLCLVPYLSLLGLGTGTAALLGELAVWLPWLRVLALIVSLAVTLAIARRWLAANAVAAPPSGCASCSGDTARYSRKRI